MNAFKPTQSLAEIAAILLPQCQEITQPLGVDSAIKVFIQLNNIMLIESKTGFQPLPYSVPRALLESESYMAQFQDQVAALAEIVINQHPLPPPEDMPPPLPIPGSGIPTIPDGSRPGDDKVEDSVLEAKVTSEMIEAGIQALKESQGTVGEATRAVFAAMGSKKEKSK